MLFKRKKKTKAEPRPEIVLSVPYSDGFKDFKRIKLDSYQDPIAEAGTRAAKASDTTDRIRFELYRFPNTSPLLRVFADGNKLGTIWSTSYPELFKAIVSGHCSKASVAWTGTGDVLLFVKIN